MSFNFNSSGPFVGGQGYRQNTGMFDAASAGAISLPEKVLGLTCLLVACAVGGVYLGYQGLNTATAAGVSGSYFLWFVVEICLLIGAQSMAARPGIGMVLFLAFGVSTGVIISPLIQILGSDGMQYVVYQALGATAAATGGATLYARTTRRDFSHWGSWLFAALIGLVVAMVIGLFLQSTTFSILISAAACVLFTMFLVYDVQKVTHAANLQGNSIRLALKIYLDIFNLFINLLSILAITQGGGRRR